MEQWYEKSPMLLEAEKEVMRQNYPDFKLDKLDDGRLFWYGQVKSTMFEDITYTLMVVYNSNHPSWVMGSSIRIYLIDPDDDSYLRNGTFRPEYTPFRLCSQPLMDTSGVLFEAVWIHHDSIIAENTLPTAVSDLRLYLAWLNIRECQKQYGHKYPDYSTLLKDFPLLNNVVSKLIYGNIRNNEDY